ncbi:MAG: DUF6282 family protein, partial [Dehalococcoidales bacterium]|nr:DUF6282 family protein [Dehalococcoidales bacterium]
NEVGGLNPAAVAMAIRMGAKVVWLPIFSAVNSCARTEASLGVKLIGPTISALDGSGRLRSEIREIINLVRERDIVLASGHLGPSEVIATVKEAKKQGLARIVVTHVHQAQLMDKALTDTELADLAEQGAFIEYSFWTCRNPILKTDPGLLAASMKAIGTKHCIISTDFGQLYNPPAPEGMRIFIETLLANGISADDINVMAKENPAYLLGLS